MTWYKATANGVRKYNGDRPDKPLCYDTRTQAEVYYSITHGATAEQEPVTDNGTDNDTPATMIGE